MFVFVDSVVFWISLARVAHAVVGTFPLLVKIHPEESQGCLARLYFVTHPLVSPLVVCSTSSSSSGSHTSNPSWVHGSSCSCPISGQLSCALAGVPQMLKCTIERSPRVNDPDDLPGFREPSSSSVASSTVNSALDVWSRAFSFATSPQANIHLLV